METDKSILVSIIVPIYKVEEEINRCIISLIKQTYRNIEIILIDDGSPDRCPIICDNYAKQDKRIFVIHKENGGLSDARNYGIKKATGDFIMFVDSDDYIELDSCEKFLQIANKNSVDFIVGGIREIRNNGFRYQKQTCFNDGEIVQANVAITKLIESLQWFAPAVINFYRRSFLINNNLDFLVGRYYEDLDFLPCIYLSANKIGFLNYNFYNYVLRESSIMTSQRNNKKVEDAFYILEKWKKRFDKITDVKLQNSLYGMLIKHYLHICRVQKVKGWRIKEVNFSFSFKYSMNFKEKIKILLFNFFPSLYIKGDAE